MNSKAQCWVQLPLGARVGCPYPPPPVMCYYNALCGQDCTILSSKCCCLQTCKTTLQQSGYQCTCPWPVWNVGIYCPGGGWWCGPENEQTETSTDLTNWNFTTSGKLGWIWLSMPPNPWQNHDYLLHQLLQCPSVKCPVMHCEAPRDGPECSGTSGVYAAKRDTLFLHYSLNSTGYSWLPESSSSK